MQKKLIALAVAGLVAAPAFAQSTVTIYGTLDYGYSRLNDNFADGVKNRNGFDSGISKANRVGFKVVEDLGNGLKVVGVLENGIGGDTGVDLTSSNPRFGFLNSTNRQSYAALAGGFGTLAFGRQYTPQHLFISAVDPFAQNGLGAAGNIVAHTKRLDNLAAYVSPNFGGFNVVLGYTFNGLAQEGAIDSGNARVWAIAPSFTAGGLFVGANYHKVKTDDDPVSTELNVWGVYAAYDFGPVKLSALYDQTKSKATSKYKDKSWLVGLSVPFTANDKLLASYAQAKQTGDDAASKEKAKQWAIGYEHSLSKRTAIYAQYASQNDKADGIRGGGVAATYGDNYTAGYQKGFAAGIRHDF
jgi:predicted porin